MAGENNKVVIVTGGSSGIGRCTASALKENGCIVYEFSRRNIPSGRVLLHLSVPTYVPIVMITRRESSTANSANINTTATSAARKSGIAAGIWV